MRNILLASAAVAALSTGAVAADLPARVPAVAPAPIFVGVNWTGFYVGVQGGYVTSRVRHSFSNGAPTDNSDPDGFFGGIHAGYNMQSGSIVYGIEADVNASDLRGSYQNVTGLASAGSARSDWNASLRGRLGVAFDRALIYATGGVAVAEWRYRGGPALPVTSGFNDTQVGWTIGAGIQYAINNNWSVRGEYRYTDFGDIRGALNPGFPAVNMRVSTQTHTFLAGLSYRFGGPAGAVVAKY